MKSRAAAPTIAESKRIDAMMQMGCALTWIKYGRHVPAECHHITSCRKRLGPLYTIPLSPWYHRGVPDPGFSQRDMRRDFGASLADGSKEFQKSHGTTELELWQKIQFVLGLSDELPPSKLVPRRVATPASEMLAAVPAAGKAAGGVDEGAGQPS